MLTSENIMGRKSEKEWHIKSLGTIAAESGKAKQKINADSIIIGTQILDIQQPIVNGNLVNPAEPMFAIAPKSLDNDNEASTSQAKLRGPKYTWPKWCPPGLPKTQKRKL